MTLPVDYNRIESCMQRLGINCGTPAELQREVEGFLAGRDVSYIMRMRFPIHIGMVSDELSQMVDRLYPRLKPYTPESVDQIRERVLEEVSSRLDEEQKKESEYSLKFWNIAGPVSRTITIQIIFLFIVANRYAPSRDSFMLFIKTMIVPCIEQIRRDHPEIQRLPLPNIDMPKCVDLGIKAVVDPILHQAEVFNTLK